MAFLNRSLLALPALLLAAGFALPAHAEDGVQLAEQKIKAALVYNFLKYTDWPPDRSTAADAPIVVWSLLGGDPFDGNLQPMAGRTVNEHSIELRAVNTDADVNACWLLVVNTSQKAAWPNLHTSLNGKDVLTVSDFDGFTGAGGMIEFTRTDNRIGVKINIASVNAAHLKVEDRLLKLANAVGPQP